MTFLPWTLAWARLRKHSVRNFLSSIAITLGLLSLLLLQGISYSTNNSLVTYSLSKLPAGDRTLTLTSSKIIATPFHYQAIDTYLVRHLTGVSRGKLTREVLYHEIADHHGIGFYFGGAENLPKSLLVTSGRLPTTCNPHLCEVIQIGGRKDSQPQIDSLGLRIVGTARNQDSQLFTGTMGPSEGTPILLANGIVSSTAMKHFANLQGANGWVSGIDLAQIATEGADGYVASILAFENQLSIDHPEITLTWPQDALGAASDQAKSISTKFILLNFVVGALLIAFLILFSLRHRREHQLFRAGLSRIGTPKGVLLQELAIEYGSPLVIGVFISVLISLAIPAILSIAAFHTNISQIYQGWPKYLFLLLGSLGFTIGFSLIGDKAWRRLVWVPLLVGTIFVLAYLHQNSANEIRFWLIAFAFALVPAIVSYFLLRGASLLVRQKDEQTYVLFREYLSVWQGVAAILTLASVLAALALSFESGISQQVALQSRDRVPLDLSLSTGPALIRPLDLGGVRDYEKLLADTKAYPVLRTGTAVRSASAVSDTLSLIGLSPDTLLAMSERSQRRLSSIIIPSKNHQENGIQMGSSKLLVAMVRHIPKEVDMLGWFLTPHGTHTSAMLNGHGDLRTLSLQTLVPSASVLVAFEFRETSDYLSRRLHAIGEGSFDVPTLSGNGSIDHIALDGRIHQLPEGVWHSKNFPYSFNGGSLYVRPVLAHSIPAVVVDPTTAGLATHGLLTLTGARDTYFQVRVGAVIKSFPSAGDRFVIMDLQQLQDNLGQVDLGAIDPIEVWISTPHADEYLKRLNFPTFKGLVAESRNRIAAEMNSNPTNVGLSGSYRIALIFALFLTIFMYGSALPLLYREGAETLFELEVIGIGPRQLRRALRKSLRITISIALLTGALIGLVVGRLFISESTPYTFIFSTLLISVILSEVGGHVLTRKFFNEVTLARS
jgi:hypothetical protein